MAATVYCGQCSIWALWALSTVKFSTLGSGEPLRLLTKTQYTSITLVNILFVLAFLADTRKTFKGPAEIRRAHLAGLLLAFLVLVLVQAGAHVGYGPIQPD